MDRNLKTKGGFIHRESCCCFPQFFGKQHQLCFLEKNKQQKIFSQRYCLKYEKWKIECENKTNPAKILSK
ncbi:hypothetical protein ADM99_13900 [Leptolinea tardivitalis]|uniref:Uncharacterized protein n=1 Tax=Leptolinea tardivitalis TaxID=229920 RepID=A0A0P6WW64_9CHLR|nr:hypothetical protein ADM99_13900 [Leptolinea tardivitalis]